MVEIPTRFFLVDQRLVHLPTCSINAPISSSSPSLQAEGVEDQDLEALEEELKQLEERFFWWVVVTYADYRWFIQLQIHVITCYQTCYRLVVWNMHVIFPFSWEWKNHPN